MGRNVFKLAVFFTCILFLAGCSKTGKSMRIDIMNPAAQLYDQGMDAYRSGDLQRAKQYFSDVVNYYPSNDLADEATFMLARCYEEEGDIVNALAYYKLLINRYPKSKRYDAAFKKVQELEEKLKEEEGSHGSSRNSNNSTGNR
ncbi:outer membrane protein assembly factor BamD [Thermosulfidibacter takaii]|nr:tetratricopeptide repeat protein [Thermosulfidibacter takaii]